MFSELIEEFLTATPTTRERMTSRDLGTTGEETLAWHLNPIQPEAGFIQHQAQKEESELIEWYWKLRKWADTTIMVSQCTREFRTRQEERRQIENCPFPGLLVPNSVHFMITQIEQLEAKAEVIKDKGEGQDLLDYQKTRPP